MKTRITNLPESEWFTSDKVHKESIEIQLDYCPVKPGTVSVSMGALQLRDNKNGGITKKRSKVVIGSIDYQKGLITFHSATSFHSTYRYDP